MKYLFFLIIFLLPVGLAYGEVGKNYEDIVIDETNQIHHWTSHYDRIQNETGNWVNYILTDNINQIEFKSSGISFVYDKNNCSFSLYNTVTNTTEISSYTSNYSVDNIPQVTSCNIIDFIQNEDGLDFTTNNNGLETFFELESIKGVEWTYEITNNKNDNSTITITETCKDCTPTSIDGDKINFDTYTLDTKNTNVNPITQEDTGHNTLKQIEETKGDLVLTYEKTLSDNELLIIDPTFSSNNPSVDGYLYDNTDDGDCADVAGGKFTANNELSVLNAGAVNVYDCQSTFIQWDTSSITDGATITDTDFTFDTQSGPNTITCDFMPMTVDTTTATDQQIMDDILNGTPYLNNNSTCDTTGNNNTVDLGASADADVQSGLATDRFAIGIKEGSEPTAGGGADQYRYLGAEEDGTSTPKPTLDIVYTSTPNSPTGLTATAINNAQINLVWITPSDCASGCTGYKIWRESPTGGGFTVLTVNTTSTAVTYSNTGLTKATQYNYKVAAWAHAGLGTNSTASAATTQNRIDAVTTLTASDIRSLSVDLDWDTATLNGGGGMNVSGYQINKTTPHANNVATVVVNNTNTNTTEYTITSLTGSTNYTFRIGVFGYFNTVENTSGNAINITTDFDPTAEFTVGSFDITQTNTDIIDIRYVRNDINVNSLFLNVTARNTYELACDLEYKLGGFNQTYTNLSNVTVDSSHVEIGFWFTNVTNDIIRVDCWNIHSDHEPARYLITRYDRNATFPLMLQFEQFRDGSFGTAGEFGVFDLITLSAIILSMIGFNRVNPAVGGIFCTVVILFLGWFEIIEMPTIVFSALALVLMLAIGVTRSDQN